MIKLVACVSVAKAPPTFLADALRDDGSTYVIHKCQSCACEVYLGLRSRRLILAAPKSYRVICVECLAVLQIATGAEIDMHPLSDLDKGAT